MSKKLKFIIPFAILTVVTGVCLSLVFVVKAQTQNEISFLQNRINELKKITSPPTVDVLSQELASPVGEPYSITISKLLIENVNLDTVIRTEIYNKSSETQTYYISNMPAQKLEDGYKEMDLNSSYVVVPLMQIISIDAGQKKPIVIWVSKLSASEYYNTEAWISIKQQSADIVQGALALRILIKGNSG